MYLILAFIAAGMFIGWLAQLVLGQRSDQIDWAMALGAGLGGSLLGGIVSTLLADEGFSGFHPAGFIGSFLGAIVLTLVWHGVRRRRSTRR